MKTLKSIGELTSIEFWRLFH